MLNINITEWLRNCPLPREVLRISMVLLESNFERFKMSAAFPKETDDFSNVDEKVCTDICLAYRRKGRKGKGIVNGSKKRKISRSG